MAVEYYEKGIEYGKNWFVVIVVVIIIIIFNLFCLCMSKRGNQCFLVDPW